MNELIARELGALADGRLGLRLKPAERIGKKCKYRGLRPAWTSFAFRDTRGKITISGSASFYAGTDLYSFGADWGSGHTGDASVLSGGLLSTTVKPNLPEAAERIERTMVLDWQGLDNEPGYNQGKTEVNLIW